MMAFETEVGPGRRRPFTLGVNMPWISYGTDFGSHPWRTPARRWTASSLRREFDEFRQMDMKVVRWFVLADGRSLRWVQLPGGPVRLAGLAPGFIEEFRLLVETFARHGDGIQLLPVLTSSSLFAPAGQQVRLRTGDFFRTGGGRDLLHGANRTLFLQLLASLVRAVAPFRRAIWMWELCNEPDGAAELRHATVPELSGLLSAMDPVCRVTGARTTIGWTSARGRALGWRIPPVVPQLHHYGTDTRALPPPAAPGGFIGEVGSSRRPPAWAEDRTFATDAFLRQPLGTKLNRLRAAGWGTVLVWSKHATDRSSDWEHVRQQLLRRPSMRASVRQGTRSPQGLTGSSRK